MVCSCINPPARKNLEKYLQDTRGITVDEYLKPLIDIQGVAPNYIGPTLKPGYDIWGVHRKAVSYGAGEYNEIDFYPLKDAQAPEDLEKTCLAPGRMV